jgi:protein involved in polysaccharide export with SLBB domain
LTHQLSNSSLCAVQRFLARCILLPLALLVALSPIVSAQATPNTPPSASPTSSLTTDATASGAGTADTGDFTLSGARTALPAGQILAILQEKPEVVIELKSLLADRLQEQGVPTQPESISDETLYSQIASSSEVRSAITDFLRARGYVSNADIQRSRSFDDNEDQPESLQTIQTLSQLPGSAQFPGASQLGGANLPMGASSLSLQNGLQLPDGIPSAAQNGAYPGNAVMGYGVNAPPRQNQREKDARNITDAPQVLHQPTPYNLLSLRDLYTQLPDSTEHLRRFGSDVFLNRDPLSSSRLGAAALGPSLDVPMGPDYVVGPGDSLTIDLWGGLAQSVTRVIDRDGRVMLPEAGDVQVAGLTVERVQSVIQNALQQQFRNAQVAVTISRLRSVRVYVVGDVQRPGACDISSLSSPLSALYAAGGPTAVGSLRTLQHYRGKQLVGEVDLYDFLLHGVRSSDDRLQGGDTLLVPPAGPQVAVYGAVKRPAIYELKDEKTLNALLEDAGGATVAASFGHITVDRIDANQHRETISFDLISSADPEDARAAIAAFQVKDGDRIHVSPILPYSERVVYMEGHVVRPGRLPYRDGMRLNDVLKSYQDMLPEPADRGEIVRLVPPDLHAETIDFNVPEALIGNSDLTLQPFDTIRIFGRYEVDAPKVTIGGEVLRPGSYPLGVGMTAAQLVRMAGGFKRDALLIDADLMSYSVVGGTKVETKRADVRIGDAVLKNDREADATLKAGDVLTIHQLTGWNDIGSSITIEGEVAHPGSYGFQEGEHLSDLLRRAGGLRETAYPEGAVLTRVEVREFEEKSRAELIRQIETSSAAARLSPNIGSGDQSAQLQLIQQQQEQVLSHLRSQPSTGRLVIHISADINSWAGTVADVEVRRGDVLRVPKRPGFVLVSGQVYNASAITFVPGKTAGWYLRRAGGSTAIANQKEIFIIRANGLVVGRRSGGHVLSTRLDPGDVVVVPQKIIGASIFWRNLLSIAQIAASVSITAAVAGI